MKICVLGIFLTVFTAHIFGKGFDNKSLLSDTATTGEKNIILNIIPTQLLSGEVRFELDVRREKQKYSVFGIGISGDLKSINITPFLTGDYFGINIFFGKKYFYKKHRFWSFVTYAKYSKQYKNDYTTIYSFLYYFNSLSREENIHIRNYYVDNYTLGTKLLTGFQPTHKSRFITNFYAGVGVRISLFYDNHISEIYERYLFIPMVTFHLGYSIGYKFGKK